MAAAAAAAAAAVDPWQHAAIGTLADRGVLHLVLDRLAEETDALCAALVCRPFRDALFRRLPARPAGPAERYAGARIVTAIRALATRPERLDWAWELPARPVWLARCDEVTVRAVAKHGTAEVLDCFPPTDDAAACAAAAESGNLPCLQHLLHNDCPWDAGTCAAAARGGHLELLRWARTPALCGGEPCEWDWRTGAHAAAGGHLELLRWAHGTGSLPWNAEAICGSAAKHGHLELLQWAWGIARPTRDPLFQGFPVAGELSARHLEVLQAAVSSGAARATT
jgi:hypothetical protein